MQGITMLIDKLEPFLGDAYQSRGVLVLLKVYWAPDFVEFVLGRFSHFYIAIAYSNSTFCGAWTPSFCEFTQNFSKTSTPLSSFENVQYLIKKKNTVYGWQGDYMWYLHMNRNWFGLICNELLW